MKNLARPKLQLGEKEKEEVYVHLKSIQKIVSKAGFTFDFWVHYIQPISNFIKFGDLELNPNYTDSFSSVFVDLATLGFKIRNKQKRKYYRVKDYTESWYVDVFSDSMVVYIHYDDEFGERDELIYIGPHLTIDGINDIING